ncbi:hypothetical protein IWX49DRAFT_594956 [Phyllosticta citricarpa]
MVAEKRGQTHHLRCLKLYCQWAALYEVDVHIVKRDGPRRQQQQQHEQLKILARALLPRYDDDDHYDDDNAAAANKNKHSAEISRLFVATVAAVVEECMQTRIAKALGWTKVTTVFKPLRDRVWPPWTKGWLRRDWDGHVGEPSDREKRRIARWWDAVQRRHGHRVGLDCGVLWETDDGEEERDNDNNENEEDLSDVSDVDAALRSAQSRSTKGQQHLTDNNNNNANENSNSNSTSDPENSEDEVDPEQRQRTHLDALLQKIYPDQAAEQDAMMQTLTFGLRGPGDQIRWTRYLWLDSYQTGKA